MKRFNINPKNAQIGGYNIPVNTVYGCFPNKNFPIYYYLDSFQPITHLLSVNTGNKIQDKKNKEHNRNIALMDAEGYYVFKIHVFNQQLNKWIITNTASPVFRELGKFLNETLPKAGIKPEDPKTWPKIYPARIKTVGPQEKKAQNSDTYLFHARWGDVFNTHMMTVNNAIPGFGPYPGLEE